MTEPTQSEVQDVLSALRRMRTMPWDYRTSDIRHVCGTAIHLIESQQKEIERLLQWVPHPSEMSGWDDEDADYEVLLEIADACELRGVEMPEHVSSAWKQCRSPPMPEYTKKLDEWAAIAGTADEDGVVWPTLAAIEKARTVFLPGYRMVPSGDGGIVFRASSWNICVNVEVDEHGNCERRTFEDSRLIERVSYDPS